MSIDMDDEILQDFLVEASELLEQLGEQLVDLEKSPDDKDLLNAVFRNFHTVKGGAGFLGLDALVEVCHRAEDVFNLLRNGERSVDAALMDVVLRAYDAVNSMIDDIRGGNEAQHADPDIIAQLERFAKGEDVVLTPASDASAPAEEAAPAAPPVEEPVVEEEASAPEAPAETAATDFDAMLDEAASGSAQEATPAASEPETPAEPAAAASDDDDLFGFDSEPAAAAAEENDEITEDEFEALLDQLHGTPEQKEEAPDATASAETSSIDGSQSDLITEDEFEQLLDDLEAKKKAAPAVASSAATVAAPATATAEAVAPAAPQPAAVATTPAPAAAAPAPAPTPAPAAKKPEPAEKKPAGGKEVASADATVRVDTKRLDDIMNLVGELVLVRNRLATLRGNMADEVAKTVGNLDLVTSDLQNAVMKTRMQPIKKVFGRFPRVVRDLARSLNKQVTLELIGEETDLDKNLVEALADPLVHLVRNSVDHGIEDPETRRKMGKPETGTVKLSAEQEGDHILLMIEDDGAGMDAEVLRRKAVEKGLLDEDSAARLDDNACYNLIFMPGFSTKAEISDISGRGVGMDVVKTRITQLNGTLNIDSRLGQGSIIQIKVPLTLAIMPTLMVKLGKQVFALPLANVIEIFDNETATTSTVDGKDVVIVREKALPLVFLSKWLVNDHTYTPPENGEGYVVVVNYGSKHIGCVVDQLIGQEEVVIKPLGTMLQGTQGLSGATITGNGRIALILDMPGLMEAYGRR